MPISYHMTKGQFESRDKFGSVTATRDVCSLPVENTVPLHQRRGMKMVRRGQNNTLIQ